MKATRLVKELEKKDKIIKMLAFSVRCRNCPESCLEIFQGSTECLNKIIAFAEKAVEELEKNPDV